MELPDYLRILRQRWIGIAVITVAMVALAALYNVTQPKVYAADSIGVIKSGEEANAALAQVSDAVAKSKAKTYVALASSRVAAQHVIEELKLDATPGGLVGSISASQPTDTTLIKVTARASTPLEAQQLSDAWIRALSAEVKELENPTGKSKQATTLKPYESAALPTAPISPAIKRNLGIGVVLGLLVGFGYAMVRNQFDRRLRSASAVERDYGVSVVGTVPKAPILAHEDGAAIELAVLTQSRNDADQSAAEAFRKLRTNLHFMNVDNPPRIIVLTSPLPSDGKSVVAANLAATIAAQGGPVILVDGDLRRPTVADTFGMVEGAGLTDVLIGRVDVDDVLQQHESLDNLQVLAAGGLPPNPSELLGSNAMKALLAKLGERSTVIVDAPPLLPVTDGAVLTAVTDGAFVVVSAGKTLDSELAAALDHIEAVRGTTLGVVLNRLPAREVYSSHYRRDIEPEKKSLFKSK